MVPNITGHFSVLIPFHPFSESFKHFDLCLNQLSSTSNFEAFPSVTDNNFLELVHPIERSSKSAWESLKHFKTLC